MNDRDWIDGVPSQENEIDNQTRFGAFVYKGPITLGPCNNQPCGALQVEGDDLTAPPVGSAGLGQLFTFTLGEAPWSSPTHLYRVQILEREWFHPLSFVWELQWRAEAQDLTDAQLWTGDWVSEWTIKNVYHIDIPLLPGSKLMFGFGNGITGGEAHAERTGTAYWRY